MAKAELRDQLGQRRVYSWAIGGNIKFKASVTLTAPSFLRFGGLHFEPGASTSDQ